MFGYYTFKAAQQSKKAEPGNNERITAIFCINGEGVALPQFLIVYRVNYLPNWYIEAQIPRN